MIQGLAAVTTWSRSADADHDRRGPGTRHRAGLLPDRVAGGDVQRPQLRAGGLGRRLVERHQQQVLVDRKRGGVAVGIVRNAEALRPGELAVEIVGRQVAVGEDRGHIAAVAGHRAGRIAGIVVELHRLAAFGRGGHVALPEQLPALRLVAKDLPLILIGAGEEDAAGHDHRRAIARQAAPATSRRCSCRRGRPSRRARWCRARFPSRRGRGNKARRGPVLLPRWRRPWQRSGGLCGLSAGSSGAGLLCRRHRFRRWDRQAWYSPLRRPAQSVSALVTRCSFRHLSRYFPPPVTAVTCPPGSSPPWRATAAQGRPPSRRARRTARRRSTARPESNLPPNRCCVATGSGLRMLPPQGRGPLGGGQRDDDPSAQQPGARKRKCLLSKILVARLLVELADFLLDRFVARLLLQRGLQRVARRSLGGILHRGASVEEIVEHQRRNDEREDRGHRGRAHGDAVGEEVGGLRLFRHGSMVLLGLSGSGSTPAARAPRGSTRSNVRRIRRRRGRVRNRCGGGEGKAAPV